MKALALAAAFTAPLGSYISELEVAPDGAAWVLQGPAQAVRVAPDGRARATALSEPALAAAIGADGHAWFSDGSGGLQRVDASGRLTTPPEAGGFDSESFSGLVAGPDGGLWSVVVADDHPRLARFMPDGGYHETPLVLPPCEEPFTPPQLVRAADGAVWANDWQCSRLLRIAPTGATDVVELPEIRTVTNLAADATGGVWFSAVEPLGGHVSAAGEVDLLPQNPDLRRLLPWAVSVAPDGRPWFATERCTLLRVDANGRVERHRAPIPARELAFDPTGRLWLASTTRVARADDPGACDQRGPKITYRWTGQVRRGVRITVDEPAELAIAATLLPGGDYERARSGPDRIFTMRRRGSFRLRLPSRWRLQRGDVIALLLQGRDRDGNSSSRTVNLRLRR